MAKQDVYPSEEEFKRTLVLFCFGEVMKLAEKEVKEGSYTLKGALIRQSATRPMMGKEALDLLDTFSRNRYVFDRSEESKCKDLQRQIDTILGADDSSAKILSECGLRVHVVHHQARFFAA